MANVNLETGKIYGCKEGTKTYYHEVGHLKFEEEAPYGNMTRQLQNVSVRALLSVMALFIIYPLDLFRGMVVLCLLVSSFSEIYEEAWCWLYANKELKLRGKKEDDARVKG